MTDVCSKGMRAGGDEGQKVRSSGLFVILTPWNASARPSAILRKTMTSQRSREMRKRPWSKGARGGPQLPLSLGQSHRWVRVGHTRPRSTRAYSSVCDSPVDIYCPDHLELWTCATRQRQAQVALRPRARTTARARGSRAFQHRPRRQRSCSNTLRVPLESRPGCRGA